jgi:hypothetical protein
MRLLAVHMRSFLVLALVLLPARQLLALPGAGASRLPKAPFTASGCSGSVCIDVQGSGTQVSDWETTAYASASVCTSADFWVNGAVERQGSTRCVAGGTQLESDWTNTSFANGTVLCNTWTGISGKPCETVG